MAVTGNPGGTGLLWTAMLTTLFVISRALTRRPLRGQLSDVANLTLLLAIAGTGTIQVVYAFTTVGALWGTNIRSCRLPIWQSAGDPSFVVPHLTRLSPEI